VRENRVVDVDPETLGTQAIELTGLNPTAPIVWDESGTYLLVGCSGRFGSLDGGIELIDPLGMKSIGWMVTEEELGGDLIDFALGPEKKGYAIVSDAASVTSVVSFDVASGTRLSTVFRSDGYELSDLIVTPCGHLVVCDRDYESPGLRIFDAVTGQAILGVMQPVDTGLPPFEVSLLD